METPDLDTDNISPPSNNCKLQGERSESPAPSCISMKSDECMGHPLEFKDGDSLLLHRLLQKVEERVNNKILTDTGNDPDPAAHPEKQLSAVIHLE
ncbi:hypothetical protein KOW79_015925 [Hemibagrus wyckioides]|uniref:Uncharacterized protein n=1 Tax=Hemibagrus wyckioides TaxID=337641 RepID=A0A9D3NFW1_9TELE|nr:hypothetical protein KOW79_015925 [Hemibagrus wyckioides]